jgi:hypothetical protein
MIHYLITLLKEIMEARVIRLNLLMQQVERKMEVDKCCDAIRCCLDSKNKTTKESILNYYFHK